MNAIPHEINSVIKDAADALHPYETTTTDKLQEFEANLTNLIGAIGIAIEINANTGNAEACTEELGYGINFLVRLIKATQDIRVKLENA